jgi:hypothetical protein
MNLIKKIPVHSRDLFKLLAQSLSFPERCTKVIIILETEELVKVICDYYPENKEELKHALRQCSYELHEIPLPKEIMVWRTPYLDA